MKNHLRPIFFFFVFLTINTSIFPQSYLLESLNSESIKDGAFLYRIVVLPFKGNGISLSTAVSFSKRMAQSIRNTNRFEVVGPEEVENHLVEKNSPLLGCVEISCGVLIAKEFQAQYLLVTDFTLMEDKNFLLDSKLVEVQLNKVEFTDFLYLAEEEINASFYDMSNRIIQHVPLVGIVVQANQSSAVITLGRIHNVKVGDQMVIYKQEGFEEAVAKDQPFETTLNRTRAIIKINRIAEYASEGSIIYSYELPDPKDKVRGIMNLEKQVGMVAQARREIDDAYKVRKEERIEIVAPVSLEDGSRHEWLARYRAAKNLRDNLNIGLLGTAALALYFASQDGVGDTKTLLALGGAGFFGFQYVKAHYSLDEIIEEGRFKKYIDNADVPFVSFSPTIPLYRLSYNF